MCVGWASEWFTLKRVVDGSVCVRQASDQRTGGPPPRASHPQQAQDDFNTANEMLPGAMRRQGGGKRRQALAALQKGVQSLGMH